MSLTIIVTWLAQYDRYSVGLGVISDDDPWDVSARLRPRVLGGQLSTPYAGDPTLVELMSFRTDAGEMPAGQVSLRQFHPPPLLLNVLPLN